MHKTMTYSKPDEKTETSTSSVCCGVFVCEECVKNLMAYCQNLSKLGYKIGQ
ncbi:hypothetical protein EXN66_Car018182 [Channa argus]|uniref:Uncharacterized protein n=1 Tax=Channa argus TaxID=215402 RepID=A0A6G1QJ58_CHAAH|nr:hypothetical protein EXN66_Car018182 [Channa argus]